MFLPRDRQTDNLYLFSISLVLLTIAFLHSALCLLPFIVGFLLIDWLRWLPKVKDIKDRYVLVTGCDSGFGHLLARKLDAMGCHVFASCLTKKGQGDLDLVTSSRCRSFLMDVTNHESVLEGYQTVKSHLPEAAGLWGLVNNAGIGGATGPVEWLNKDHYRTVLDVNLVGTIDVTTTFLPLLKLARGRIVNTASILGRMSNGYLLPYSISAYGIEAFSDGLRRQVAHHGITVHILEPGVFLTDMTQPERVASVVDDVYRQTSPGVREGFDDTYKERLIAAVRSGLRYMTNKYPDAVPETAIHALTATYPKSRYSVGSLTRLLFIPMSYMPTTLQDFLLTTMAGAPKSKLIDN